MGLVALAVVGLLASSSSVTAQPVSVPRRSSVGPPTSRAVLAPWRLVAGDEFGAGALDGWKWRAYHSTYGDANHELACLTPQNVTEGGGTLRIRAFKRSWRCPNGSWRKYTSGFIGSREAGRYFPLETRISVRAKLPHAQGLWPAAWLRHKRGAGTAEVDLMEYFHSATPGLTTQTLHLAGRGVVAQRDTWFETPSRSGGWHVWTVEITRADQDGDGRRDDLSFRFFVDGMPTVTYVDTEAAWADATDPGATWDLALNLAVGGDWVGNPDGALGVLEGIGRCAQSGVPPACATAGVRRVSWSDPAQSTYEIDWVHVFGRKA